MSVPKHINSKYSAIIFEDTDSLIKARVSATGSFKLTGLNIGWVITTMLVTDSAVKIPASPYPNRNSIEIHNISTTATLYLGPDNTVTADQVVGTTSGKELPPDSYWSIDITDAIDIWAVCPTGESAMIKIMEVA